KRRLAHDIRGIRPTLTTSKPHLHCRGGRFIPLEEECRSRHARYEPLDISLDVPVAILTGSNMGGKTCVLQTLLFLQILAQCGMYVPADEFSTRVYSWIDVAGEDREARKRGLSAYGLEIRRLVEILDAVERGPGLVVFDEFAHTTSAEESRALMQAVVERFAEAEGSVALFATHIACSLPPDRGRMFRMAGLDRERARAFFSGKTSGACDLEDLLGHINALMCYQVRAVNDAPAPAGSDALAVARLLGLDERIAARAELLLAEETARRARSGNALLCAEPTDCSKEEKSQNPERTIRSVRT
ncbi:MAG: hypothetical protein N3A02_03850, partial [Rectinema sp.]|nr:hypothetical protein [Rectinema sp.]